MDYKIIAVDFDGTLCENAWPDIGEPITEVFDYIKRQQEEGAQIILWTCREGQKLLDAVYWCNKRGLYFNAINQNVPSIIESFGGDCRKIYADVYIDDLSFNHRPFKVHLKDALQEKLEELTARGFEVSLEEKGGLVQIHMCHSHFHQYWSHPISVIPEGSSVEDVVINGLRVLEKDIVTRFGMRGIKL